MERVIADTSVLVAVERGDVALEGLIRPDDDVAMAAVTVAELLVGVARGDAGRREGRRSLVEGLLAVVEVIPYDLSVARAHASLLSCTLESGTPRGAYDLIIAATALADRRTVLTMDLRGFDGLPGVEVRR